MKICGLTRLEDALAAAELGADAVGFNFYAPSPRNVTVEAAARIAAGLPPFVTRVGILVNADDALVARALGEVPLDLLQFHGDETPQACERFGHPFIKALRVRPDTDLTAELARFRGARGVLLDSWQAHLRGGTGESFDWSLVPAERRMPVILAGGLSADNVGEAIARVRPFGVDVSGGVEREKGIKDAHMMAAFIAAVRRADEEIMSSLGPGAESR